ncbi:LOW QUALITY PROTEIN: sacsin-like [Lytechinus pictus]|uniref:LOW QUALITY PROTEIN: sacsin-like n=1 Tax=Lytechinus pictus TaxID=7653 RepID=UPI0030B9CA7E
MATQGGGKDTDRKKKKRKHGEIAVQPSDRDGTSSAEPSAKNTKRDKEKGTEKSKEKVSTDFGISTPPLVEYLKGILREYSDGQILKELVQNAEDAGADTVKFLYDMRQHGTKTLYKDSLQPYQGPAVYSFNNAKFKEADWEGIQQPARSKKKTDPLKVGRFGIGFNSVYHITDLPSIMSDQTLAFIDPLEEHFFDSKGRVKAGWRFSLRSDREIFSKCHDQFQPYNNVFPGVTGGISTGYFDGTLFRFPLRQEANELSEKIYQQEDTLDEVLQAFQADANVAMLFLRSLNNIEVLKRSPDYQDLSLIVRVQREHDQGTCPPGADITSRLQSYISNNSGCRESIKFIDSVTFTTETRRESKKEHWIVCHHIAGDSMSQELTDLAGKQGHLPWVAVAIPMSSSETSNVADEAENNDGRVFCFLPLPPGEESRTGLPVHVHGFFGVNSDRRGIKWLGPDQTDTPAQWNQLLVRELIPMVYVDAIKFIVDMQKSRGELTADCIYRSWPDYEDVCGNWDILLEPFYNALFSESIIHSDNSGWKNIADVHFNELQVDEETEKAILKCFNFKGIAHARVPGVCRKAIRKYYDLQISTVSVSSLCRCLNDDPTILERLTNDEKLLILQFILQEGAMQDLEGLCLLPLDNGGFDVFTSSGERRVYIPTPEFHRQLVPGGCDQFIRTIQKELPLHQLLSNMSGHYQLKTLTIEIVAKLLKNLERSWIDDQGIWIHEPQEPTLNTWLEEVWSMLYRESPSKLLLFNGIHLLPLFADDSDSRRLFPLCSKSRVIQRCYSTADGKVEFKDDVENILHDIGMRVTDCPGYILRHPAVIRDGYIKMPTPDGVVQCLLLSDEKVLIPKLRSFSASYRDTLVEFLAQAKLGDNGKELLKQLPLFKRVDGTGQSNKHSFSVEESLGYIECSQVDIPNPLKLTGLLIDGRAKSNQYLLQKLEACPLSKYQVIVNVLEEIRKGQLYTQHERQVALQWIMERWEDVKINCKSIVGILREMKFIPNKNASLLSPSELLDPRDALIYELFESQGVFPMDPFDSPQIVEAFSQLGMRGQSGVSSSELNACVDMIEESQSPDKSHLLLELLSKSPDLLCTSVIDHMKQKECIPCRQSPPEYYPSAIEWYGNSTSRLSTPTETLREMKSAVLMCGASKRFCSHADWSRFSEVFTKLGMYTPSLLLTEVVAQLEYCVKYTKDRTGEDTSDIVPMLKEIYSFFMQEMHEHVNIKDLILNQVESCIWNGSGFSEPSRICTRKLPFDLYPYMVSIPKATSAFGELFEVLGVQTDMMANSCALVDILYEIKEACEGEEIDEVFQQGQLQLVLQILNHLQAAGDLSEDARLRLLVPSQKGKCHLIPVEKGAYVDRDWLRQSTDSENLDDDEDFTLVHSNISMNLAMFLHIRPVSRLLLDSEEFQGFTQAGQHEDLTMRLYNILKNNYVDTAIVSEMIQNAEDAGAQVVNFLIDMRKNGDANQKLFDPEMISCQGPALWVYNDAVFTDQDFENILRLGGRTKEKDAQKIGKFGTGFNSVYRITDVPSFVSREYMQFFDPHTTYLGNVLPNKYQPGVRLRLNDTKALRRFPDQFKPFHGVFGIDLCGKNKPFNYSGTLFRLPLRSQEAAQKSQICKESYNGAKLIDLMKKIWDLSHNLLVFTKNVKRVAVFFLDEKCSDPSMAEELFTIQKTEQSTRMNDENIEISTESFKFTMTPKGSEVMAHEPEGGRYLDNVKVTCKTSNQASALATSPDGKDCGLSPEGAVAFPFHKPSMSSFEKKIYCFLPLSITSMFPVHINGAFAVKEDRRSLHMPVPNGTLISEKWNHLLLVDVICRAYIALMSDIVFIQRVKEVYGPDISPDQLWPDTDDVPKNSECSALFNAFYKAMVNGFEGREPSLFWNDNELHQFSQVVFLSQEVQKETSVRDIIRKVLSNYLSSKQVMSLTDKTWRALERVDLLDSVLKSTYDFNRFFTEAFLPRISQVQSDMRNQLVLFALNKRDDTLKQKLKDVKCIPVEGGPNLRKPCDLVHPRGKVAPLYTESDKVFPLGNLFNDTNTLTSLTQLGMVKDNIHQKVFLERCHSVHILHSTNKKAAQNRSKALLKYLSEALGRGDWSREGHFKEDLVRIPFLPILCERNQDPALPWLKTINTCPYASANDIYSHSKRNIVSSMYIVVHESNDWKLPWNVEDFLGIRHKYPSTEDVIQQFSNIRSHYEVNSESISNRDLKMICKDIYERVENTCRERVADGIYNELQNQKFFLVGSKFVEISVISDRNSLPPYLFEASRFLKRYPSLLKHAGLKNEFDARDYEGVLRLLYMKSNGQPLSNDDTEVAILAAQRLAGLPHGEEEHADTFLPDEQNCMRPVSDLCYSDVDWFENDEIELHRCHTKISFMVARKLKVKDIRQQMLQAFDMDFPGDEFGQHEKLTTRIKRILDSYPSDETILNADDAGATEIHFVYDPRKHKGHKLLGDGMKALQGPALCVFNNQSFTDDDIRGIQNLGEGSKADHMGKIGRYGVGFNAVYQLTDCPSFISKGERWCMFDPLLKYVPGANPTRPGRQVKVNSSVRRSYPHNFQCYMEDKLTGGEEDFTIFRFPLRQEASTLSTNVWQAEDIRKLLRDFEIAAFECLLFLKNVTKIRISKVTNSGVIRSTHVVSAEMTRSEGEKKMDFLQKVQDIALTKQGNVTLESEQVEVIYQMKLKGVKREEDWVVCQQVSYSDADEEHTRKKHKLLPVGAVAARLPDRGKGNNCKRREGINGKAFCFLPLPIQTGLPVHVHGYFALDHESRRHLWEGSKTDEQTKWNLYITQKVIAPAYVKLLSWIQKFFIEKYDWSGSLASKNKVQTLKLLEKYHNYFPNAGKGSSWRKLQDAVFEIVVVEALLLFPSLYRNDDGGNYFFLSWKTPIPSPDGSDLDLGYFNTLPGQMTDHCTSSIHDNPMTPEIQESINKLKDTLIEVTFPLIESPIWIMHNMRNVCKHLNQEAVNSGGEPNYEVREVTPSHVMSFLRGDNPLQRQLPIAISSSRIHSKDRLIGLINYCKSKETNLQESLHGLPLLFTMDETLRMFSHDDQVFATEFCDLFWPQSHRFLHIDFLHRLSQKADVFCKIDMREVSKLLDGCFPFLKCTSNKMITPRTCHPPKWFRRLWILLESLSKNVEYFTDFANNLKVELGSWAILPVTETKPTDGRSNNSHQVALQRLYVDQPSESRKGYWPLYSALESLNVYKIEKSVLDENNHRLIKHFVLHEHMGNNARVLDALMYWVDRDPGRFKILKERQHNEILRSFCYCDADLRTVRCLPCFKTIAGDFVSIRKCQTVLVLPSMIPEKEQDKWIDGSGAIFLQDNKSLEPLYKKLALTITTEFDVYMKYILPVFGKLSDESRLEHLVHIKQLLHSLPNPKSQNYKDIRVAAIRRLGLRDLCFINGMSGNLLKARDLYDPEVEVFSLMLKDKFPSTHIIESLGLAFLREIGLQTTVTADLFLSFAHRVRESYPDAEDRKIKSTALVSELVRNCNLHKNYSFCQKVSVIDFLVTDRIDQQLESIHPPFIKDGTLIRYSSSLSSAHTKLIWSTNSILPEYAALRQCFSCKTQLDDQLGKAQEPGLKSVIQHLQNICNRLQQNNSKKLSFSEDLSGVLHEIMTFLSSECTGESCSHEVPCGMCCIIREELQNVPIVFLELEDEHRLVKAEQISRTLEGNFEPFLYQLPDKWVPFFKLFQLVGGTGKASIRQYASVLRSIYERGENAWGNPNVVSMVERATTSLYEQLKKTDQMQIAALFDSGQVLYLPSCHQNLERSDQLLLNDVDHYLRRLRKSKLPLIKFFQDQERIGQEAVARLPEMMKPTLVSKKVKEILSKAGNESQRCILGGQEPCEFAKRLQILHSKEFLQAVCIIMKDNGKKVDDETKSLLRNSLNGLKITCMQRLHSILQINGEYIEGSENEVPSFINNESELFVQHSAGESITETLLSVVINVNQVLGNVFEDKAYIHVSALLSQKSPSTLHKVLSKFNIAAESMEDDTSFKLPDPGTTIPEQLYHLIEQDPWTSFSVDDFIAYAQTDEDGEYYIYAIVVKRISNESLKSVYLVNIGKEKPIEANVLDIHKIHIPKSTSGMELVLSEKVHSEDAGPCLTGNQESSFPTDVEQAKRQVTTELEEIWKLPEEHRRKAIRRMLLKWHPDKHPEGPKELFHEAFKHLKSELQRLEKGISSSFYKDLFRSTEKRAREDRRRYTHFGGFRGRGGFRRRRGRSSESGFWNFEDFFTSASRTPDIRNARRWFRQGQEDLRAARHDLNPHDDEPSLEWVAYKCHQSVEKALKAAKLAIDGQHDYTHSISSLAYQVEGRINSADFKKNVDMLSSLVTDQQARYPDKCASSQIPHEVFRDKSRGEEMIDLARQILGNVQSFLPSRS